MVTEQQRTEDPTRTMHSRITDALEWLNVNVGVFVAYWCLISVFAYYYEVVARFVFNSPTNWVHESMLLMFGRLVSGGEYDPTRIRPACICWCLYLELTNILQPLYRITHLELFALFACRK